ncbi:toxin-antitoxin system YwqK family antitoxin [Flavobacterium sp. ov086]|uniref:toxin-antitoxin system YwqK family antitoxin n=1 Tax=Flavobacterium sp. ov086 TaxID=1761785 RepID=UPI000B68FEA6|nr:toxin-antitoxin system YwqK family antitoxin [Flavobacterium sp. ov086]SNR24982.1 Antitoxin component YwqK of the YwqJK toxin-antitoxin module [Flavobacterium sp. ov086]
MKKTLLFVILLNVLTSCTNKKAQNVETASTVSSITKGSISKELGKEEFEDKLESTNTNDKILREYSGFTFEETGYHDNGQISLIIVKPKGTTTRDIVQGTDVRILVSYFENGKIESKMRSMGTKKEGETIAYYPSGQLRSRDNYTGGIQIDESVRYYENGQLMYKMKYVYGKPDGQSISYYENGKIKSKENFVDGLSDGEFVRYYEKNGQLEVRTNSIMGKYNGKCIWYFQNGNASKIENYSNGVLIGESKRYSEDGIIKQTIDNDNGVTTDYDVHGNPVIKNE